VIPGLSASVARGEKIALTGRNGAGKTTLLKSLIRSAGEFIGDEDKHFAIDGGDVTWGHEVTVGYFPQDFGDTVDKRSGMTALNWLWQFDPISFATCVAQGRMLAAGRRSPTSALSGEVLS
jgi:ATPase subunit of ABC transporter with duplicated ATPase domains